MLPWPKWSPSEEKDWNREFFFYHAHYEFDSRLGQTIFCMTGVTREDHTILLHLTGHDPYCYIKVAGGLEHARTLVLFWEQRARATGHIYFMHQKNWILTQIEKLNCWIRNVTEVTCEDLVEDRPRLRIGTFYRVSFVHPVLVKMFREYVQYSHGKAEEPHVPIWSYSTMQDDFDSMLVYEANVDYVERVIADSHFPPCVWYSVRIWQDSLFAKTFPDKFDNLAHRYDIWIAAKISDVSPTGDVTPHSTRVLAYDIESENEDGDHMPRAASNAVLSIDVYAYRRAKPDEAVSFGFELGSCDSHVDHLLIFENDRDLLLCFRAFVRRSCCDAIVAHNGNGFDLPYMLKRATALELSNWDYLGLLKRRARITCSKNKGFSKHNAVIPGLLVVDTMRYEQELPGSRSLSLSHLALRYLKDLNKMDVYPDELSRLQRSHEGRTKKHKYCARDAELVMRIENVQQAILLSMNTAQFSVPIQTILNRSTGAKGEGYILHCASNAAHPQIMLVLAFMPRALHDRPQIRVRGEYQGDKEYEGAINLVPTPLYIAPEIGPTRKIILTLDFASLYPSIIRHRNISPDTLTRRDTIAEMHYREGIDYWASPDYEDRGGFRVVLPVADNPCFISSQIRRGLLPQVQDRLFELRSAVKKKMMPVIKEFDGMPITHPSYDTLQSQLKQLRAEETTVKLLSVAVYGLMARTQRENIRYISMEVASTITREGRGLILFTRDTVHASFPHARVVGGDTDSVFVLSEVPNDDESAYCFGKAVEDELNRHFTSPIHINLENISSAFSSYRCKNYIKLARALKPGGGLCESALIVRGENFKKRNFPRNLQQACTKIMNILFTDKPISNRLEVAMTEIRNQCQRIIDYDVPIGDLQETSKLSKDLKDYSIRNLGKGPAMLKKRYAEQVAESMEPQENDGVHDAERRSKKVHMPETGDVASYVIVPISTEYPSPKVTQRSMFALKAIREGIYYDRDYYLKQMKKTFAASFGQAIVTLNKENEEVEKRVNQQRNFVSGKRTHTPVLDRLSRLPPKKLQEKLLENERKQRTQEFMKIIDKKIGNLRLINQPVSASSGILRFMHKVPTCKMCHLTFCECDQPAKKSELLNKIEEFKKQRESAWAKCAECVQGVPEDAEACKSFRSCPNFSWRSHIDFCMKRVRSEIGDIEDFMLSRRN